MLYLIGAGLADKDISYSGIEACKKSRKVYLDSYTTIFTNEKVEFIEKAIGKKVELLDRSDLEENAKELVEKASGNDIAILVGGDPLMATTHKILFIEAKKHGVNTKVIHSASIISAIMGESCLDMYRFGAIATLPRWSEHYKPVSFYEKIYSNLSMNLHSIVLFDYNKEELSVKPAEAYSILEKAEQAYKKGILGNGRKVFLFCNIGMENERKLYLEIEALKAIDEKGMYAMVIPAKLSAIEEEAIASTYM